MGVCFLKIKAGDTFCSISRSFKNPFENAAGFSVIHVMGEIWGGTVGFETSGTTRPHSGRNQASDSWKHLDVLCFSLSTLI